MRPAPMFLIFGYGPQCNKVPNPCLSGTLGEPKKQMTSDKCAYRVRSAFLRIQPHTGTHTHYRGGCYIFRSAHISWRARFRIRPRSGLTRHGSCTNRSLKVYDMTSATLNTNKC